MKATNIRVTVTTGRPDCVKALKSRFNAMRRAPTLWSAVVVLALSVVDLLSFLFLLSVFSLDNLIRKVARDIGMPFQGDVPLLLRLGVFSFLVTLLTILVPSGVVMAAFAVANNDFYNGFKTMPQPADSSEVTARVTADISGTGAVNDVIKLCRLPADCISTGWILESDQLDSGGAPSLTQDFGLLNAAETAVSAAAADGGKWLTASTALRGANSYVDFWTGTAAEKRAQLKMSPASGNRTVGLVNQAVGNGAAAAAAKVGLTLWYRPAQYGN
jgi:hypothetical protein